MSIYDTLNTQQQEAVFYTQGPLLILAGAGSGKTRVLTHRIAYLIEEEGVNPYNILAITFTNKAAGEMRERVDRLVGFGSESIWVSTFHSMCVRILRRYIEKIGFDNSFTIYDTDDQKVVIREICKRLDIDTKMIKERAILGMISSAKNELISPEEFEMNTMGDFGKKKVAEAYKEYQIVLRKNNALDFDDLLAKTVELFRTCPEVLRSYQKRFQYIMVDEYQDTNTVQFKLISMLADTEERNLCVVGDDDQSIYKFRGANIRNILNFEEVFPNAKVIKLEQNYRSTQMILDAANGVIANNLGRKKKTLWTANEAGERVKFVCFENAYDEAEFVIGEIAGDAREGKYSYQDCAILYRTNAQSRMFEEKLVIANIPYQLVGGVNFYARKEIKDMLCYLKTINNAQDDLAVRRIINVPKRGIGQTSINRIQDYAARMGLGFFEALERADDIPGLGRCIEKIKSFVNLIYRMHMLLETNLISEVLEHVLEETQYISLLQDETEEEIQARQENIDELNNKIIDYEKQTENPVLSDFLEQVALVADVDSLAEDDNRVVLMTLHSAKGLEFPHVFLTGMEEGMFPGYLSINSEDPTDLEEERRLCYVGITRAMKELTMTAAKQRMVHGETMYCATSRFVKEIPAEYIETAGVPERKIKKPPVATEYVQAKTAFRQKAFAKKSFEVKKSDGIEYAAGDRVSHFKFGQGVVKEIREGGRDYEVTVDFDKVGIKIMFANFAKLKKIE